MKIGFKIRHTPDFSLGNLIYSEEGWILHSETDIQGVAPGQFATIYTPDNHFCLGSAMIEKR